MDSIEVSLIEYYGEGLTYARQERYSLVLCLVARGADAPKAYDEIIDKWADLDDLTGSEILFIFAAPNMYEVERGEDIKKNGTVKFSPSGVLFASDLKKKKPLTQITTILRRKWTDDQKPAHTPVPPNKKELLQAQTQQISELRNFLKIDESDIPCLHITSLRNDHNAYLPIGDTSTIYKIIKRLVESLRGLRSIDERLEELKHKRLQLKSQLKSQRPSHVILKKLVENIEQIRLDEKANAELLRDFVEALGKHAIKPSLESKTKCISLFKVVRQTLAKSIFWPEIKSNTQRLIDIAQREDSSSPVDTELSFNTIDRILSEEEVCYKSERELRLEAENICEPDRIISEIRPTPSLERLPMEKRKNVILFMGANPCNQTRLCLTGETKEIDRRLRQSGYPDKFEVEQQWEMQPKEIHGLILRFHPSIVHFSGHGSREGSLIFVDESGKAKPAKQAAVAEIFRLLNDIVRCVVLNGCYSEIQARAIAQDIDVVVGMSDAIGDKDAIEFAAAFYEALAYGRSVANAFDLAKAAIDISDLPDKDVPVLLSKNGINPSNLFF